MEKRPVSRLPSVDEMQGYYFPGGETAYFQYRSGEDFYEIPLRLDQLFLMEEHFIILRNRIGGSLLRSDR
jgi:hypothetical protein